MAKRKPGQELGSRHQPTFIDIAGAPPGHICSASGCQRTRSVANDYLQEIGGAQSIPRKRLNFLASFIPRLLCQRGAWPPKGISDKDAILLFFAATAACVDTEANGMRVQNMRGYAEVAEELRAANENPEEERSEHALPVTE